MGRALFCFLLILIFLSFKSHAQLGLQRVTLPRTKAGLALVLPQNFYNHHLGFACKKESQLQKFTGVNLFLRLGSKQYVDYMEGKPNAAALLQQAPALIPLPYKR